MTRPLIPSSFSARLRPWKASSLKPLSSSWPWSTIRPTRSCSAGSAAVAVVAGVASSSSEPPQRGEREHREEQGKWGADAASESLSVRF